MKYSKHLRGVRMMDWKRK